MDNSPFSKLSKEIRDTIYEYSLPDPQRVVDISRGQTPEVVITQLCRQMRVEAHQSSLTPYKLVHCSSTRPSRSKRLPLPRPSSNAFGSAAQERRRKLRRKLPTTAIPVPLEADDGRASSGFEHRSHSRPRSPQLLHATLASSQGLQNIRRTVEVPQKLSPTLQ